MDPTKLVRAHEPDDFIERNTARLKFFIKTKYVFSRVPAFWVPIMTLLYIFFDALWFHEGVPDVYLWVAAALFADTNIDKFVLRLLQLHVARAGIAHRPPRDDDDPFWMRILLRLAVRRRGAMKTLVILTEYAVALLLLLHFLGRIDANRVFLGWSWNPIAWFADWQMADVTLTPNLALVVGIVLVSGFLTMLTNAVFYLRIRPVREAAWGVLERLIREAPLPAKVFAETLLPRFRGKRADDTNCCPYTEMAKTLLNIHPIFLSDRDRILPHYDNLVEELKILIADESRTASDLWSYLERRLSMLAGRPFREPDPPAS